MALKDLVVSEQEVGEEVLERILRGYVNLATDTRRVILTTEGFKLPARLKILLVLAARHAWRFVAPGQEVAVTMTLEEIADETGISGNTLRPTITKLKEDHVVEAPSRGVYRLLPSSLGKVEAELLEPRRA